MAVTIVPVVALNPVAGVQLYVVAPLTVSVAAVAAQTVALFTMSVGVEVVATVAVTVTEHEFASLMVTV